MRNSHAPCQVNPPSGWRQKWLNLSGAPCGIGEVPTATFFPRHPWELEEKATFMPASDEQMFKEMLQLKTAAGRRKEGKKACFPIHEWTRGTKGICHYQYLTLILLLFTLDFVSENGNAMCTIHTT